MTWRNIDLARNTISVVQEKTGAELELAVHRKLREVLDGWPREHVVVLRRSPESLGNLMAEAISAAGLPTRCVLHGLRKAAARRLAEAGATPHEIAAITGHKTLQEVARYTKKVEQRGLAVAGIAKLREQKKH
jgi:integrase